jgi:hypothetical protein
MIFPLILAFLFSSQSTELISSDPNGVAANQDSTRASSSADGRFIVFESYADNLVPGAIVTDWNVFLKDRATGQVTLISAAPSGNSGNGFSNSALITGFGQQITFRTSATDILPGGNPPEHAVLFNRSTAAWEIVSRNSSQELANSGGGGAAITSDGRFLLLQTSATNLDPRDAGCTSCNPENLFIRDLIQKTTKRVTVGINGEWMNSPPYFPLRGRAISGDGRFIVLTTRASNLVPGYGNNRLHIYLVDTWNESTTLVSSSASGGHANGDSQWASISLDGRYVAFESNATDLLPGGNLAGNIFRWNRITGLMEIVSVLADGSAANSGSSQADISPAGNILTFVSGATNFDLNDLNFVDDSFRKNMITGEVSLLSLTNSGQQGERSSDNPIFGGSPNRVLFITDSSSFGAVNGTDSIFMRLLPSQDSDGDQLADDLEAFIGSNPLDRDTDDDGLSDWEEYAIYATSATNPDSDGDWIWDGTEAGRDSGIPGDSGNGILGTDLGIFRPDLDPMTTTSPADADSDEDGLLDGEEDLNLDGLRDLDESDPIAYDTDGDGLSDGLESGVTSRNPSTDLFRFVPDLNPATTTSPILKDTDGGGMPDGLEDINGDGAFQFGEFDPLNSQDDRFDLIVPPLVAGTTVVIEIDNARPGSTGVVAYSLTGSGPSPSGRGFDLELSQPIELLSTQTLFLGHGEFIADIPASAPSGMPVWLQGIEQMFFNEVYRTSNLVATTIQ